MIKVYGASDDLIEIIGSTHKDDEIGCYNRDVRIWFVDGTVIRAGYPKKDIGVWWISIEKQGDAYQSLEICNDEDGALYSDVFEIDSEIIKHKVIDKDDQG